MPQPGAIDIVVNLFTPDEVRGGQTGFDANFTSQVRMPEASRNGVETDHAGIERSLPIAVRAATWPRRP